METLGENRMKMERYKEGRKEVKNEELAEAEQEGKKKKKKTGRK